NPGSLRRVRPVRFERRESKEEVARPYFEAAEREGRSGVVLIGVAQERSGYGQAGAGGGSEGHPHRVRPADTRSQPPLLLRPRPRVGPRVREACCYVPYPALALSQRP